MSGPYTTITVEAYNDIVLTIQTLRTRIQKARELLENNFPKEALELLKTENDKIIGDQK